MFSQCVFTRRHVQESLLRVPFWRAFGDPAIPLLDTYPEKTVTQKDTHTPMLIAAVFTAAKTWKQLKCPWREKRIKQVWYVYTMEYYSARKRSEIGSFGETWMDLESIIQSEVKSEREKQISYVKAYMWKSEKKICIDNLIDKAVIETQTERSKGMGTMAEREGERDESGVWDWHTHTFTYKIDN